MSLEAIELLNLIRRNVLDPEVRCDSGGRSTLEQHECATLDIATAEHDTRFHAELFFSFVDDGVIDCARLSALVVAEWRVGFNKCCEYASAACCSLWRPRRNVAAYTAA
jgi:hypothetical protein